jgi:hypothetical protein
VVELVFLLSVDQSQADVKEAMIGYGWPVSMPAHLGSVVTWPCGALLLIELRNTESSLIAAIFSRTHLYIYLLSHGSFNDAISGRDYKASNGRMIKKSYIKEVEPIRGGS